MKLDSAREVEFSEYLSPIMLLNLTLAGVFYNVENEPSVMTSKNVMNENPFLTLKKTPALAPVDFFL